ncbi:uncharacterized protein CIMG_13341 [Coccidioides immitis RS]|uniref:Uncharacterized protein n=1 Tax=Coccidioides immitis (strain RS) TaxID=246410 RepID=A0A0D8JUH8_COCIM|nr:uncharacterized protein CIMG_13341 [Coccidioides immitis RS]KJF60947.1 hypothetical protein CIMG_13341 [Coccidioides immitis RS]
MFSIELVELALRSEDKDAYQLELKLYWCSLLYCWGLLYCQFYNTVKKIFTASQHFSFANKNLDILTLDSRLQFYKTQKKYWVTATVLQTMN